MDLTSIAVLAIVLGFMLVAIEIFLIPGIGFAGILGTICILCGGGIIWQQYGPAAGLLCMATSGGLAGLGLWRFGHSKMARKFILTHELAHESQDEKERTQLLGQIGQASTSLRPAGSARFGEQQIDVVTAGEFIEQDTNVQVVEVEGFRVVVEAADADTSKKEKETSE